VETGEIIDAITLELRKVRGVDYDGGSPIYLRRLINEGNAEFARDSRIVKGDILLDVEAEQPLYDVYQEHPENPAISRRGIEVLEVWFQGRRLKLMSRAALPERWEDIIETPTNYFMQEADIICVFPTPPDEVTNGIKLYCVLLGNTVVSNEDEPNIPPEYHQALVWYAVWRELPEQHPRAQWYLDRYLLNVERAKAAAARNMTPVPRHVRPHW